MNKRIILLILIVVVIMAIVIAFSKLCSKNSENNNVSVEINADLIENNDEIQEQEEIEVYEEETIKDIPTSNPIETPKPNTTNISSNSQYYIKVNTQMNTVTIYDKDKNGEYTIPIKAMVCSTGDDTPKNCKYILGGKRWEWKELFGHVYGQYTTHINLNILFHSVPYLVNKDKSSLEYWEYDKLGTTASAGCIRLTVEDAKWIYENCLKGSIVEFYSDSNPGPLGKPSAMKISDNLECRGWDPTDPSDNNAWKNISTEISNPITEVTLKETNIPKSKNERIQ